MSIEFDIESVLKVSFPVCTPYAWLEEGFAVTTTNLPCCQDSVKYQSPREKFLPWRKEESGAVVTITHEARKTGGVSKRVRSRGPHSWVHIL